MVSLGRIGAGIATGGLSEAYRAGAGALGVDKKFLLGTPAEEAPGEFDTNAFNLGQLDYITGAAQQGIDGAQGRNSPNSRAALINQRPQSQFRNQEMALANQLGRVASGQDAGAGELAVRRQFAQANAAQQSAARMRGGNAALAARAGARGIGDMAVNAAGQSQIAGLQDQTQARGLLANVLQQGRGADIGLATTQAGLQQQTNLANQSAALQQQGMNDQYQLGMMGQLTEAQKAQMQAQMQLQALRLSPEQAGYLGPILQAGGSVGAAAAMSDRRTKKNVEDGRGAVREFLSKLKASTWDYKDEKHGRGRHAGVMAQDVEKSKLGKDIVIETPEGKMLDTKKALGAVLASVADLHSRLERAERGK